MARFQIAFVLMVMLAGAAATPPTTLAGIDDYYAIESIPLPQGVVGEIGGLDFLPDGRLVVCFFREGVWFYEPTTKRWTHYAFGVHEPLGVHAKSPTEIIVMQRPELTRLLDTDGDGKADHFETICDDFGMSGNYHEFAYGPAVDEQGNYYVGLNTASNGAGIFREVRGEFNPLGRPGRMYACVPYRGWILKIAPDGTMTPWASGFRSPNGLGFDDKGRLFVTDNQGDWIGTSPLCHAEKGKFYGHVSSLVWQAGFEGDPLKRPVQELMALRTPPAVQFPHGAMANSPTQPICDKTGGKFGPFAGQMLVGEMNRGRIMRVMLEEVAGALQGAAVPFYDGTGLSGGVNRFAFDQAGALWVGHTKRDAGWGGGTGLQRITWKGEAPMDVLRMNLTQDGFKLTFTRPLDKQTAANPAAFRFTRYFYEYHRGYGSKQFDVRAAEVASATVSDDGRSVTLKLAEPMKAGYVYEMHLKGIESSDGHDVVNTYVVYNVNRLLDGATDQPQFRPLPPPPPADAVQLGAGETVIEAEAAQLRGPKVAGNNQGFTGKGFADFSGPADEWVRWYVKADQAGSYALSFRYALGGGARPLRLFVNDNLVVKSLPFTDSGGWTTWTELEATVQLQAGENTIRLQSFGQSGPNVDHMKIAPAP